MGDSVVISIATRQDVAILVIHRLETLPFFVASRGVCRTFTRKATTEDEEKCRRLQRREMQGNIRFYLS